MKKEHALDYIIMGLYLISTVLFFVGTRNIDIGFNMALLDEWESEVFINEEILNAKETYLSGMKFIVLSYAGFLSTFVLLLFGEKLLV